MNFRTTGRIGAGLALGLFAILLQVPAQADPQPAPDPTTRPTGSITVTVLDSSGKPVTGAEVRLVTLRAIRRATTNPSDGRPKLRSLPTLARGTTDSNGTFTFDNIPTGRYAVLATMRHTGHGHSRVELVPAADGPSSATVTVTLAPSNSIPGRHQRIPGDGGNGDDPTTQPSN
jgi:hypothetical protein